MTLSSVNPFGNQPYSCKYFELLEERKKLPAWEQKQEIINSIVNNQIIIICGETGSGKSTQIPQFIINSDKIPGKVCCTQPRRLPTKSLARRVANEMDVEIGKQVGYCVRFDDNSSKETILKYMTDGMLLREMIDDPLLKKYNIIILDEVHERTLATDILLGLLKPLMKQRDNLKLILMSATLDNNSFSEFFDSAPLFRIPGKLYPVDILYAKEPCKDYIDSAIETVLHIHLIELPGDILLFLTGEQEIEDACTRIQNLITKDMPSLQCLPLYSSLSIEKQERIFKTKSNHTKSNTRRCIISTNIAETSITIEGINYVIDPGFSKQKIYNPRTCKESLVVSPISQASAKQRAGRAGRTSYGKAYRLYTEYSYNNDLPVNSYPEILRSNLDFIFLLLKKLNVSDFINFDFMDPPAPETMMRALEILNYLNAIDDEGNLTSLGKQMSEFPIKSELSNMLLLSVNYNCSSEILSIVSMLSVPNCFERPVNCKKNADVAKENFIHPDGDHLTLLNVFHAWKHNKEDCKWAYDNYLNQKSLKQAGEIRNQLANIMKKLNIPITSTPFESKEYYPNIIKALLNGLFMQVAYLDNDGKYILVKHNQPVLLHPSTGLYENPKWVIYNDNILTSSHYIRTVTKIKPEWLFKIAPQYYQLSYFPKNKGTLRLQEIQNKLQSKKDNILNDITKLSLE